MDKYSESNALDQIKAGNISVSYIDETVKSVLRTKFSLGLFESEIASLNLTNSTSLRPFTDPYPYDDYLSTLRTSKTRDLLHQMEQETIVLLENRNSVLPLSKDIGSIALIGPQVDRVSVRTPIPDENFPFTYDIVRRLRLLQRESEWHQPAGRLHPAVGEYVHNN